MEQLGDTLRTNLRRGDTISRCSVSQYILMLPKANYEDSCMVCRRLIAAFNHSHPYVTAKINFMVQPLHPSICVP
jgi:GGDEF domain-containing protein